MTRIRTEIKIKYNKNNQPIDIIGDKLTPMNITQKLVTSSKLRVFIQPFLIDGFVFDGGSINCPANGTWYAGVETSSKQVRLLPRLGHRGWIPVAKITSTTATITQIDQIAPAIYPTRIPRTLEKVNKNQPINVVVMGSSLTQSGGGNVDWPGMLFGAGQISKYKIPTTVSVNYTGVGGQPNQYQLAQLGLSQYNSSYGFGSSGFPSQFDLASKENGRSRLFDDVDLVVIGCLANGGDYRLDIIEPLARKLKSAGVEVIFVTDNTQGPSNSQEQMLSSGLYIDGPKVIDVANLYGFEVADTAAYVLEAHIRSNGVGIFGDSIHMSNGAPVGPEYVSPANGHEAWARAVRSIFPINVITTHTQINEYPITFNQGTGGFTSYGASTVNTASNKLVIAKNTSTSTQWGTWVTLPVMAKVGDVITVRQVVEWSSVRPVWGMQSGGWGSNNSGVADSGVEGTVVLVATKDTNQLLLFATNDAAPLNETLRIVSVNIQVTLAGTSTAHRTISNQQIEQKQMPPVRVVADMKTPSDAYIILPHNEQYIKSSNPNKGTLGSHPWGNGQFARKFSYATGTDQDMLTLTTGKKACMSAVCPVGYSIIHYREPSDGACEFTVSHNGTLVKTLNIGTVPFGNEWYLPIYSPTEFGATNANNSRDSYEITVTQGTLKIAAFVALTADCEFISTDSMKFVGNWLPKENSRSGLPGISTDTAGSYASCVSQGKRLLWVVSSNPGSKLVETYHEKSLATNISTSGNFHVRTVTTGQNGKLHIIKCIETNPTGSQENGRSLHIGGAIQVNDR